MNEKRLACAGVFSKNAAATDPQPCGVQEFPSAAACLIGHPEPHFILFTADPDPESGQWRFCHGSVSYINTQHLPLVVPREVCRIILCHPASSICINLYTAALLRVKNRARSVLRRRSLVPRLCALLGVCLEEGGRGWRHSS